MEPHQVQENLAHHYLQKMLEATFPLQQGDDREITLQALIRAAEMLKDRFEQELAELRVEETE